MQVVAHEIGHLLGMNHDFEQKEACSNGTSGSNCKDRVGPPRILNGTECHGYMDYCRGNHPGDYADNKWSLCSAHDLKNYVKGLNQNECGPFCRRCGPFCLRPLSGEATEREISEMEYSNACEILPFISRSLAACGSCYLNETKLLSRHHCDACFTALTGVSGYSPSLDCFVTNPAIKRCDPEGGTSFAEIAACVEAECSSMMLGEERWRVQTGEYPHFHKGHDS